MSRPWLSAFERATKMSCMRPWEMGFAAPTFASIPFLKMSQILGTAARIVGANSWMAPGGISP